MLFSYKTKYKVVTWYTPYQLVYGLHPLIPVVPIVGGSQRNSISVRVWTNRVLKLEKLQEAKMQVVETIGITNGIEYYGVSKKIQKNCSILVIMLCGFQKEINHT